MSLNRGRFVFAVRPTLTLLTLLATLTFPRHADASDIRIAAEAAYSSEATEDEVPVLTSIPPISYTDTAFVVSNFDDTPPEIKLFEAEYSALSDIKAGGALGISMKDVNWGNFIYGFTHPAIQKMDSIIELLEEVNISGSGSGSGDITENLYLDSLMFFVIVLAGTVFFLKSRGPSKTHRREPIER